MTDKTKTEAIEKAKQEYDDADAALDAALVADAKEADDAYVPGTNEKKTH